jgi:hypothetical protein
MYLQTPDTFLDVVCLVPRASAASHRIDTLSNSQGSRTPALQPDQQDTYYLQNRFKYYLHA